MKRIDGVLGNVHVDEDLERARERHADEGTLERVVIEADRRQRSRFRTTTDAGTDVGVVLEKPALSIGDVLARDEDRMIVVAFEPLEALAVDLPEPTGETLEAALELGHRVGNQHWDLAIDDGVAYVPLEADRHIVERVVADVVPGATVRAETVDAALFVTDLEGDGEREPPHGNEHGHGAGSDHSHETDHSHSHVNDHRHSHANDHDHAHESNHSHSRDDGHDHQHGD
ncbi:urease accessory protein UreE [Halostagnicola larsenii XH-48]|uniref:Urease accessory protein UreE n=1 Tax=Halostagnicola larsenii XH-48 TaxID=797299 RepID=W0JKX2_9EURY|nr:urease accessory protein UreE [Halostagnicola larsenii]AHF99248.1 urease accessory protein UreE [Halostagnicola larsenii XH-48]